MKFILSSFYFFTCLTVQAMTVDQVGDNSYVVNYPSDVDSGQKFSYETSADGVCKRLGFEKSAPQSVRPDKNLVRTLSVDDKGNVYRVATSWAMEKVICLNEVVGKKLNLNRVFYPENVTDPDTGLKLGYVLPTPVRGDYYHLIGKKICEKLRYENFIIGSLEFGDKDTSPVVEVFGLPIGVRREKHTFSIPVMNVLCVNKTKDWLALPIEKEVIIDNPTHHTSHLPFSGGIYMAKNVKDAICKILGHESSMPHQELSFGQSKTDTVVIDKNQKIVNARSLDYALNEIRCVKKTDG